MQYQSLVLYAADKFYRAKMSCNQLLTRVLAMHLLIMNILPVFIIKKQVS